MPEDKIKKTARIYALQNAIQFQGKANAKAVVGRVIAVLHKEGFSPKEIILIVNSVVEEINKIKPEKQVAELTKLAPKLLVKEKQVRDFSLPDLQDAEKGRVITRFPPEPNGYLHIGHAKAAIVDFEYAKKYDGKFILRFDDTNPENADLEFYDAQKEDLKWLGISWDDEYNTSDNIDKHYELAEQLIKQGDAYVCKCSSETFKKHRSIGTECDCRHNSPDENMSQWKEMQSSLNNVALKLKGDMISANTAMRDPTLFRIIEKSHPIQKDKYRVWPTYDFAGAVEDSISGVTHPFRTKEYELRDEVYFKLLDLLNLRKPHLLEFARLSIEGMPVSKRKIKPLIDKGLVTGFDDIRLPTLRGLKKRGILPEAIKQFVISQGISKVESSTDFGLLEAENRRIIDPNAKRYFFVKEPVKLIVENAPLKIKEINLHPTNNELGSRTIETDKTFYVQKSDLQALKNGDIFRLKELFNVKITSKNKDIIGEFAGEDLITDSAKIQWTTNKYIDMKVLIPHPLFKDEEFDAGSLETIGGYAEEAVSKLKTDEIIQFERFGFVRIEKEKNIVKGFFTHK
jgi:glutamyl-tRNA synthetase